MKQPVWVIASSEGVAECIATWITNKIVPIMSFYGSEEEAQKRINTYPMGHAGRYRPFQVLVEV